MQERSPGLLHGRGLEDRHTETDYDSSRFSGPARVLLPASRHGPHKSIPSNANKHSTMNIIKGVLNAATEVGKAPRTSQLASQGPARVSGLFNSAH